MRGRSYSSSPPRGYGRRGRSPGLRRRHGGHGRGDGPTSLLVRNLRLDCRPEDLRRPFGQFGPVKDIYLPRDYHTGQPRGFGFVQYVDPADATEAKYQMDGQILHGLELTVVFAKENRKKPTEMRERERGGRDSVYDRRQSPRYSQSPATRYGRSTSHSRDYYSPPPRRRYSRSISPRERRYGRERSFSHSPVRKRSPPYNGSRSCSQSPVRGSSPNGYRSCSQSPGMAHSPVRTRNRNRSPSHSRSRSPYLVDYSREPGKGGFPSQ